MFLNIKSLVNSKITLGVVTTALAALSLNACAQRVVTEGDNISGQASTVNAALPDREAPTAASLITGASDSAAAERIKADVSWLAADARGGRDAGTPGYAAAADYVAQRFAELGVKPGYKGQYLQPVTLRITKRDDEAAYMALKSRDGSTTEFTHKVEFVGGRSAQGKPFAVEAPLVFAGFGVSVPGYDDYAGLDVDGKIVVVFGGAPRALNSEVRAHAGSGRTKAETAAARGAVGMISVSANMNDPEGAWARAVAFPDRGRWGWVHPDGRAKVPADSIAPTVSLGPEGAAKVFDGAPMSFEDVRKIANEQDADNPLRGFPLRMSAELKGSGLITDLTSPNVVGLIEGSDPILKNEVVVLSAHLDHIGKQRPRNGGDDWINNGALDNAMGISTLLEVAKRFKNGDKPRRSIVLVAVTAEEKGLVGSDYFAHYPSLEGKQMVANVNLDMPLVLYDFVDVIAFGAERSSLGELVRAAAAKMNVGVVPDPYPNLSLFVRSDHYNFVRQGVPSVFLFMGTGNGGQETFTNFMQTNYHRPSDDINQSIEWDDAARFATLNFLIASEIANSEETPSWRDGDYFGETYSQ